MTHEFCHTRVDGLIGMITSTERIDFFGRVQPEFRSDSVPERFGGLSAQQSVFPGVAAEHDGVDGLGGEPQILLVSSKQSGRLLGRDDPPEIENYPLYHNQRDCPFEVNDPPQIGCLEFVRLFLADNGKST